MTNDDALEALTLEQWLERIQFLHPMEIDMGLHRVREVAERLGLCHPKALAPLVVTVAGTNGKGSCTAMLDAVLRAASYRVGTYTSPHILRYNERVSLQGQAAQDALFCAAFTQIWQARQGVSLSYFEYGTLAALLILQQAELDVVILEVGLGGRLDAVNIIDTDLAVISSIDLDHQEWLGDTRELIAYEKAGIFRSGVPAVCGDLDLPESIRKVAHDLGCSLYQQGIDYGIAAQNGNAYSIRSDSSVSLDDKLPNPATWGWWGHDRAGEPVQHARLPLPALDLINAATVLQVLTLLPASIPVSAIHAGLDGIGLAGRFQRLHNAEHPVPVIVDVAHNPHAANLLAAKLNKLRAQGMTGRIHLLLAMMHDKDQPGFFLALENAVDICYIAHFAQPRCLKAEKLLEKLQIAAPEAQFLGPFQTLTGAYEQACKNSAEDDIIVATGSFFTVAEVMQIINESNLRRSRR
jgi:dihydrofolate synthase/folylpolyglutamate synthase